MTLRTVKFKVPTVMSGAIGNPELGEMTFESEAVRADMTIEVEALRLVRAAPELLTALEALLREAEFPEDHSIADLAKTADQARAAIAHAKEG